MGSLSNIRDLELDRIQFINVLLNAQHEIKLHPSKIQFEHQQGLSELLDSLIYRTEDYLEKKERELFKKMLPRDTPIRGHCINNILALYGIKKEEEFLSDLEDPLEAILTKNKIKNKNKLLLLHSFLAKLENRGNYY